MQDLKSAVSECAQGLANLYLLFIIQKDLKGINKLGLALKTCRYQQTKRCLFCFKVTAN